MQNQATSNAQLHARELRRAMTDSERRLWSRLRMEQLGVKFRRQHPLGNYIADFACLSPKLIVELDGSQHLEQQEYDRRRDAFFKRHGFIVLRFPTDQPFVNLEGVLSVIASEIAARGPHPNLPPEGEGAEIGARGPHPNLPPEGEGAESAARGPHPNLPPEGEGANTRSFP